MKATLKSAFPLFYYLLLLTAVFLLLEISFFLQSIHIYFDDYNFIAKHIAIPYAIIPAVLFFIFAQLLVHIAYTLLIWICTLAAATAFKLSVATRDKLGIALWLLGILMILIANQYFFPNAKMTELTRVLIPDTMIEYVWVIFSVLTLSAAIFTIYKLISAMTKVQVLTGMAVAVCLLSYMSYQRYFYLTTDAATVERPNIIIIGIDSLRPDFLDYFGAQQKTIFFSSFLKQSTVFNNAFTPLARTFPSWMGILSGKYPKEIGVRYNLMNRQLLNTTSFLPTLLQQAGYQTFFATDETRFSNIDKSFGFDEVITPPMGLNDFLLGTFNDFPLSNLVVNTFIGKKLFPHSYANRPVHVLYDPDSFLSKLRPYLKQARSKPLFLAVHFCLPHYPYIWASHSGIIDRDAVSRYQASISRVDQQVHDFMATLEENKLLQHAMVILLSDHGEALELPGDRITAALSYISSAKGEEAKKIPRFYPPSADEQEVNQSVGHGTDVLGFSQYHSLLAFRLYGLGTQSVKPMTDYVLLLDIKPTILQFLNIPDKNSGISLLNVILGSANKVTTRPHFFLESDFSPEAVRSVHPETRNLIFEGIEIFAIDPKTTRIRVKDSMGQLIISSKQYANIDHDWVLALYPQEKQKMTAVLVNLKTGKWTTDLRLPFAQQAPLKRMLYALKQFYGTDITSRECVQN